MSDAMPEKLSKRTVIKSILFVSGFWMLTGAFMYGLYILFESVDISGALTQFLNGLFR